MVGGDAGLHITRIIRFETAKITEVTFLILVLCANVTPQVLTVNGLITTDTTRKALFLKMYIICVLLKQLITCKFRIADFTFQLV